jgi:hypothetical protein
MTEESTVFDLEGVYVAATGRMHMRASPAGEPLKLPLNDSDLAAVEHLPEYRRVCCWLMLPDAHQKCMREDFNPHLNGRSLIWKAEACAGDPHHASSCCARLCSRALQGDTKLMSFSTASRSLGFDREQQLQACRGCAQIA